MSRRKEAANSRVTNQIAKKKSNVQVKSRIKDNHPNKADSTISRGTPPNKKSSNNIRHSNTSKNSFNEGKERGIHSTLEIISPREAMRVLEYDSRFLLTEEDYRNRSRMDTFLMNNTINYYLCINTWLMLVADTSANASRALQVRISQKGLIDTIRFYSGVSDSIIRDSIESSWDADAFGVVSWLLQDTTDLHQVLQLLRFPKKLSLIGSSLIDKQSLEDFLSVNAECKIRNQNEFPYWLIQALKAKIAKMLRYYKFDESLGYFSAGTTADAGKVLMNKISSYATNLPYIYDKSLALPIPNDYCGIPRFYNTARRRTTVLVKAVPKSYKASRIIAEEPAANQFRMLAIAKALRVAIKKSGYDRYCDTTDQSRNRELCRIASIDGSYATIDKSHASDSVSDTLVSSIFPTKIVDQFEECRSIYVTEGKTRRLMQMFSTSGSGLTFDVESIVFTALALVAGDYYHLYTGQKVLNPSVFGDDVIIDDRVADTYIDFCGLLGFTVNVDKTFTHCQTDGYYRESCGVEYFNGIDVASKFYPRKPLRKNDAESLASIVSLQKRLYSNYRINLFLRDIILQMEPRMTSHIVGTDCEDMWTEEPIFRISEKGHLHLTLSATATRKVTEDQKSTFAYHLLEHYYYYNFLVNGPKYADDISRLLKVSDPLRSDSDVTGTRVKWSYTVEN